LALVIFFVVIGSSLLGGDGNSGSPGSGSSSNDFSLGQGITGRFAPLPALPPGLEAVSNYYQFTTDTNNQPIVSDIEVPLRENVSDPTGLGFYSYFGARWQRIAEVKAVENKKAAADVTSIPANVAVLRVKAQQYQVAGSVPAGGTLHVDAKVDI